MQHDVTLNKVDWEMIDEFVSKHPELETFTIVTNNDSGIGYTVAIEYWHNIDGKVAKTTVEICGVENW